MFNISRGLMIPSLLGSKAMAFNFGRPALNDSFHYSKFQVGLVNRLRKEETILLREAVNKTVI